MPKHNAVADYFTYPLIPLLLTAESGEEFSTKYHALEKLLVTNIDVKELSIELANNNFSNSYRGVVVYNENTKQANLAFENSILPELSIAEDRLIVFMFTGIGNQYIDMAKGLYEKAPIFRKFFDYSCNYLEPLLKRNIKEIIFPNSGTIAEGFAEESVSPKRFDLKKMLDKSRLKSTEESLLDKTEYLHPLLFIVEYSLAQLLIQWGIAPKALIGHSVGEYVAATISGVVSINDALTLIARRAQLIEKLPQGMMLTVLTSKDEIDSILKENSKLFLATENSPISCTISGAEEDIIKLESELEKKDVVFLRLSADRAFHSPLMEPIEGEFKKVFDMIKLKELKIPLLSNLTGDWATDDQMADSNNWFLHTCKTVQFSEGVKRLLDIRNSVLIEIGPGQTLTGFAYQHKFKNKNPNAMILSVLKNANDNSSDNDFLFNSLCKLWINGVKIDWNEVLKFNK